MAIAALLKERGPFFLAGQVIQNISAEVLRVTGGTGR
jgi:hypothetical protein